VLPAGIHTFQLFLHAINRVSDIHKYSLNYFATGDDDKSDFNILGDSDRVFDFALENIYSCQSF
jgi:hypothetical protein